MTVFSSSSRAFPELSPTLLAYFAVWFAVFIWTDISAKLLSSKVFVTDLPLAAGHLYVDEAASVSEPLLRAALRGLLLLLGLDLSRLASDCHIPTQLASLAALQEFDPVRLGMPESGATGTNSRLLTLAADG